MIPLLTPFGVLRLLPLMLGYYEAALITIDVIRFYDLLCLSVPLLVESRAEVRTSAGETGRQRPQYLHRDIPDSNPRL